jgi:uncharacterized membrane protein
MAPRGLRGFLLVVSLLGFLAAFYLTFQHYGGGLPKCFGADGCALVQTSRYSAVLGIPIALVGALFFATMFSLGVALLVAPTRGVPIAYKILAHVGMLAAIPLFLIQAVVLHAYCTLCLATEFVLVTLWLASYALPSSPSPAGAAGGGEAEGGKTAGERLEDESSAPGGCPDTPEDGLYSSGARRFLRSLRGIWGERSKEG